MKSIYLILCLLMAHSAMGQFFHYEILEGKEFFEDGKVYVKIEYNKNSDKIATEIQPRLPLSSTIPSQIQGKNIYIAYRLNIKQGTSLLYKNSASRYTSSRTGLYKSEWSASHKAYKDPYVLEITGNFTVAGNHEGYGPALFKVKLKVTPHYFSSYDATALVDPNVKETHEFVLDTKSDYYPRIQGSVKIYVKQDGKALKKPVGYQEKDYVLKTKYLYKGKVIRSFNEEGTTFDTPFFYNEKDDYYIKIGKKSLIISSNKNFTAGNAEIEVVAELSKKGKVIFKKSEKVTINIPAFSTYSFRLTGAQLLADGQKMFKHNSKWNNQGRDPLPDLICEVKIDGVELGRTAEKEDAYQTNYGCDVTINYIPNKPVALIFSLIDKDAFLNPNDLLLKQEAPLLDFMKNKPATVTDNYLGSFSISH